MTCEQQPEIPNGFTWKDLTAIQGKIPMPTDWFSKERVDGKVRSYFLTREPITSDSPEGFFTTGLSMYIAPRVNQDFNRPPSEVAKRFVTKQKEMTPVSDYEIKLDGKLVVCRRNFTIGRKFLVGGRIIEPMNVYAEATGNDHTGTLFTMIFESPIEKWPEDKEIGCVMINNRVLSQEI